MLLESLNIVPELAFYNTMAVLLWILLFSMLIGNWEKIRNYQQQVFALGVGSFVFLSGLFFWLLGTEVITGEFIEPFGELMYLVYIFGIFIVGVFTYANTWYPLLQLRLTSEFVNWGPYTSYGKDGSTTIHVTWESESLSMISVVKYGETDQCKQTHVNSLENATDHHAHHLEGLKPNTKYYYRISRDDFLRISIFKTGPAIGSTDPFEIVVLSDIHSTTSSLDLPFLAMDANSADKICVISVGDCVSEGDKEKSWRNFMYKASPNMGTSVWMHAAGESDTPNPGAYHRFIKTYDHPYTDFKQGAYYSWNVGNAHFVMLDTNNAGQDDRWLSDAQMEWLEKDLQENTAPKKGWVFVFLHHSLYSTGAHGFNHELINWIGPILQEHHVDIVFTGHDHHFEAFQIDQDKDWGGNLYLTVGGFGKIDQWISRQRVNPIYKWKDRIHVASETLFEEGQPEHVRRMDEFASEHQIIGILKHNFTKVKVNGDSATLQVISRKGETLWEKVVSRSK